MSATELIILNSAGVKRDDRPDMPFVLEGEFNPPEFMRVAFVCLYGGTEHLKVRGVTREALLEVNRLNGWSEMHRLRRMTVTGPDGVTDRWERLDG